MDLQELAKKYLSENKHMQLATMHDGSPWICTVYFVHDENYNLYWMSARERQHSVDITNNSNTAITIVRDIERKQALQIVGAAHEVGDAELERVDTLYQNKFGSKDYDLNEIMKHNSTGRAYWVFKPITISFWDEVNFPDSPKQHLDISTVD